MSKPVSTAEKVLDVLLLFGSSQPELSVDEICEFIQAPRSTTYRYIRILCDKGLLEKGRGGSLRLGPRLLQLSFVSQRNLDIGTIALPIMEEIVRQTRETVLLTRRSGYSAVCLERVEGPQAVRISFERGHVQPLHAGASSKILLAYLDEDQQNAYLAQPLEVYTEHTIVSPQGLREQLRSIRRQGYCISDGEVDEGARALAVPILDHNKRLVAALSTAGPSFRMSDAVIKQHLVLLQAASVQIQAQLPG